MTEWFENPNLWTDLATSIFTRAQWDAAPTEVERVIKLVNLPAGAAVLDLPCGPGRHSLEFARRGFRVTGVDITSGYIDKARAGASAAGFTADWLVADMRAFNRENEFDLAINLYTSIGYFKNPDDDLRALRNVHAALKPGGALVVETMSREILARIFQARDWQRLEDGTLLLQDRRLKDDWSAIEVEWTLIRDGQTRSHTFSHRLYCGDDLRNTLREAGFDRVTLYGNLAGAPYNQTAERLVAVARK